MRLEKVFDLKVTVILYCSFDIDRDTLLKLKLILNVFGTL